MGKIARRVTYDDLAKVPPHLVAEIIDGELFTSPRPRSRHARAAVRLSRIVGNHFDDSDERPGTWWFLIEPELHLGGEVIVPDLAGWRRERMPEMPDVAAFELAPDWVCEITSPSTWKIDRLFKAPTYARHGIPFGWFIDPVARGLELYRLQYAHWTLIDTYVGDDAFRIEPFESVEIRLGDLWLA